MNAELARAIWLWLPARTDSRRVTLPDTIAAALALPPAEVRATLKAMDAGGHVVRDSATGTSSGWHRGKPLPAPPPDPEGPPPLSLFDTEDGAA